MNLQKLKPNKNFISSVLIAIVIGLFVSAIFVLADWTSPPATPPTCPASDPSCNTPLNVSNFSQTKSGALGVSGVFHAWGGATGSNDGLIVSNGNVGIGATVYYPGGQYPYALTLPNNSSYNYGGGIAYKWDTYAGGKLCINGDCKTSWPPVVTGTVKNVEVVSDSTQYGCNGGRIIHCPSGKKPIGGGCSVGVGYYLEGSYPSSDGWQCWATQPGTGAYCNLYAICANY